MTGISYADYYLPQNKISIGQYITDNKINVNIEEFTSFSGIEYIYILESKDYIGILKSMLDKYFDNSNCDPANFKHIIYTNLSNFTQDNVNIPYLLQKDYGLENASIIYLNNACASCIQAIQIGSALIKDKKDKILILSVTSNLTDKDRFMDITVTGDAAGILILSYEDHAKIEIIDSFSMADGNYSYNLYYQKEFKVDKLRLLIGNIIVTQKMLLRNNLEANSISMYIPQSINTEVYKMYAKYLNISDKQMFFDNISNGGHLENVDTIRNLLSCIDNMKEGDLFIIMGIGLLSLDAMYSVILCKNNKYSEGIVL